MAREGADVDALHLIAGQLEDLIKALGLIGMTEAAKLRKTSRASIFQLVERGRLNSEKILGKRYVYTDELLNFKQEKPGPALGTHYNRKPKVKSAKSKAK